LKVDPGVIVAPQFAQSSDITTSHISPAER